MFDIGWSELILIGTIALIVVGPKDLPEMFRQIGRFTAKARSMAREFSRAMEDAAKESGVNDVASDLRKATSARALGLDAVKTAATKFESWDPMRASRTTPAQNVAAAEEVRHSAAAVTAPPPAAEALKAPPVQQPARPRPQPVRRRKVDSATVQRKPVPRKPHPKKTDR
ncbi:Sec-independent protein translocase protein TatB [Falsirhodobacter algicola]|uniref:Twin-arginine translocase subunit TatB n=1 Tax=Falsirhodobacter algicola TaxID=2692330 RepID=A0A8J8MS38_9RHOB|nr:Sec-independent protein translocase protein TatB [Falsirhodobacter algicola]QUS35499.1 twin-arginine translocase subunit TatB [Falsirhodobacter algicola]